MLLLVVVGLVGLKRLGLKFLSTMEVVVEWSFSLHTTVGNVFLEVRSCPLRDWVVWCPFCSLMSHLLKGFVVFLEEFLLLSMMVLLMGLYIKIYVKPLIFMVWRGISTPSFFEVEFLELVQFGLVVFLLQIVVLWARWLPILCLLALTSEILQIFTILSQ